MKDSLAIPTACQITSTAAKAHLPVRNSLFWFCLALGFLFGLTITVLPVTFRVFQRIFGAGYEMQGRTEGLYFAGSLLGTVLGGYATSRLKAQRSVRLGLLAGGLGCLLIGWASSFLQVQVGCVLMGAGVNWLVVVYGTVLAQHFQAVRQRAFAAVALAASLGGTLAPFLVGLYLSTPWMKWGWPWWIPYILLASAFFLCFLWARSIPATRMEPESDAKRARPQGSMTALLREGALWLIGLGAILHGLGQMGAVVWLARLYAARLHLAESQVGLMISANSVGMLMGRIVWTSIGGRLPDRVLLGCSAAAGSICYLLTIWNGSYSGGLLLMFLAGMGMSGDHISLGSYTALRFRDCAAQAFAFFQAVGAVGSGLGPYLIGFVGERTGTLEYSVWMIPITIGSLSLMAFVWELASRFEMSRPHCTTLH